MPRRTKKEKQRSERELRLLLKARFARAESMILAAKLALEVHGPGETLELHIVAVMEEVYEAEKLNNGWWR